MINYQGELRVQTSFNQSQCYVGWVKRSETQQTHYVGWVERSETQQTHLKSTNPCSSAAFCYTK